MKNFLPVLLPALALLTLGGCAGTSALSTTENDGVYYSSQDRTTQNAPASVAAATPAETESGDEISNPDYATGDKRTSTVTESTEYYDDDYAYSSRIRRFHQPYYRGFGYGYNDFMYADPFWYGGSSYYGNSFYDPFCGPSYGYGGYGNSYVNINIGYGRPWGYGYNPWRYGRGFGNGYYDNYYGNYGGYGSYGYGSNYGGYNNYYNINNYYGSGVGTTRNVRYGPRPSRSAEAGTGGRANTSTGNATITRGRVQEGGVAQPTGGRAAVDGSTPTGVLPLPGQGRARVTEAGTAGGAAPAGTSVGSAVVGQPARSRGVREATDQKVLERETSYQTGSGRVVEQINNGGDAPQPAVSGGRSRGWRTGEAAGSGTESAPQPQYPEPRRSRYSELNTNQSGETQRAEQPVRRQRTYEAPQPSEQPTRSYEAPQRSEQPVRTYEAPQRSEQPTRTYEAPQRSYSEPSRSPAPSNDGGGNSGGGRGRGRN